MSDSESANVETSSADEQVSQVEKSSPHQETSDSNAGELQERIKQLEIELEGSDEDIKKLQQKNKHLEEELSSQTAENEKQSQLIVSLKSQISALEEVVTNLKATVAANANANANANASKPATTSTTSDSSSSGSSTGTLRDRKTFFEQQKQTPAPAPAPAPVTEKTVTRKPVQKIEPLESTPAPSSSSSSSVDGSSGGIVSTPQGGAKKVVSIFEQKKEEPSSTAAPVKTLNRSSTWSPSKWGQNNSETCAVCTKVVYVTEKIAADDKVYHKNCFRCAHCNNVLKLGNYAGLSGKFYCKPHFKQLFKTKGNYNEGFGKEKLTHEWATQHTQQ